MNLLTITNLYPRPDQPQRGMYNKQLFSALAEKLRLSVEQIKQPTTNNQQPTTDQMTNVVLVPEWRIWRWGRIRNWKDSACQRSTTLYLPVFYFPLMGGSLSAWTYKQSLEYQTSSVKWKGDNPFQDCDAVFVSWLYPDGAAAVRVAEKLGKPVWIQVLGSDRFYLRNPFCRGQILKACHYAKGVLPNCKFLADELIKEGVDEKKVHVVPNGVDSDLFKYRSKEEAIKKLQVTPVINTPSFDRAGGQASYKLQGFLPALAGPLEAEATQQPRNKYGDQALNNPTTKLVLFVGNLIHVKGVDLLLEAWSVLVKTSTHSHANTPILLLIGEGKLRKKLERQAGRLGIADCVHFLGSRPHDEIALWMNIAGCLCLPSRSEGMPNVVLEAFASGLPVVATDVGNCAEIFTREPSGIVVETGNYGAISEGIMNVLQSEYDRKQIAERCAKKYSWQKSAKQIMDVLSV
ncbi:glycosyltransferase [Verrucomicrobiota bacterium]